MQIQLRIRVYTYHALCKEDRGGGAYAHGCATQYFSISNFDIIVFSFHVPPPVPPSKSHFAHINDYTGLLLLRSCNLRFKLDGHTASVLAGYTQRVQRSRKEEQQLKRNTRKGTRWTTY